MSFRYPCRIHNKVTFDETVLEEIIRQIAIWAPPVIVAVVLHEISHGWVANRLGDPTAARLGRLTLNPIAHVDLFGTILVPLTLVVAGSPFVFGYAKPVPVNFHNLRNPKRDMVWVALAGPAMNLALALVCTIILRSLMPLSGAGKSGFDLVGVLVLMAQAGILINIALAVFNLLPLPPLDGGRVLVGLLPEPFSGLVARVEPFGFIILIALLFTRALDGIIRPPMEFLIRMFLGLC